MSKGENKHKETDNQILTILIILMTLRSERKMQNFGKQEHHTDQLGSEGKRQ